MRKLMLLAISGLLALTIAAGAATMAQGVPAPLTNIQVKHHVAFVRFANENINVIVLRRGRMRHLVRRINLTPSSKPIRTVKLGQLAKGGYTLSLHGPVFAETIYFGISASDALL